MKKLCLIIIAISVYNIYCGEKNMSIHKNDNGTYSVQKNNLELIINPIFGGRIVSFKMNDYEFLVQEKDNHESFGSTIWPSPQSIWNWPPLKTLDSEPYKVLKDDSVLEIKSGKDSLTGLSFTKIIGNSLSDNSLKLDFKVINEEEKSLSVSPWQITRVKKGGILFFPMGEGEQKIKYFPLAKTFEKDGIVWYKSDKNEILDNHRLNTADGKEGWIAYAVDGKLFVKKFQDNKPDKFAPGESEVLFYTSGNADYLEIEVQGVYEKLEKEKFTNWSVEWFAFNIPQNIIIEAGNNELANFVRAEINK
jgi:hypothetical protein